MKIKTYHEASDKLQELAKEAIEQGNKDVASALDDVRERLKFCWSKTVEREANEEKE